MSEQPVIYPAGDVPEWDITDRMRKSLRIAGLSTEAMADHLEVSRNSVSNWLNDRYEPTSATLRVWALRCGVSYEWLVTGVAADQPENDASPQLANGVS